MNARELLGGLALFLMPSTFACDCKPTASVGEALRSSHLIVVGTILHAVYNKELEQTTGYLDTLSQRRKRLYFGPVLVNEYTILVTEAFKGALIGDTLIVRTALDPVTDCGLRLRIGEVYFVYANTVSRGDGYYDQARPITYTTSACSRTRPYARAELRAIRRALHR